MNIKFKFQINTKTYFGARKISLLEVGNWLKNLLMGEAKVAIDVDDSKTKN